ncbi:MAG TPA: acyltransferase [Candidatus Tidjanibacter gallistercoris]|nr:acyltransferase [Candidatus Tidjanibacter gallistercoris]
MIPNIDDILAIDSEEAFARAAMEVFAFQAEQCAPYRDFLDAAGIAPDGVSSPAEIPHMPIEIFKSRKVYCAEREPETVFTSSTTGGDTPSRHYVVHTEHYRRTLRKAFSCFYGAPESWSFYALLPCYLERGGSSLVWMADELIKSGGGGFFLDEYERLLECMAADSRPKILLGVSYALLDLAERYAPRLRNTVVMETGGMKGRRTELPKEELHRILCAAFGTEVIHSEYGMAELTSQAYSAGGGIFRCPPWMRVGVRDFNDPFETMAPGRRGGINITDLANLHSCAFIETQDAGVAYSDGSFSVLGRMDRTQTRGCNLMVD